MAGFGRMEFVIQDSAGNALSGVSVEVRRQGAQVNGAHAGAQTVFTVDDPGGVIDGDVVAVNTGSVTRTVSAGGVTATTITVGGAGFNNAADDDRLTIASALPTIYNDTVGNETKANPLTTDATGYAFCYLVGGKYDVLVSGGGATTRLYQDMACNGGEIMRSNIFSGTAWHFDSLRALAATDEALVVSENSDGTDLFKVMGDGEIQAGIAGATHSLTGSLAVSTSIAATTTVTGGTGVTATTGDVQSTAGDVVTRRLIATRGTALVNGDFTVDATWGVGATIAVDSGSYDTSGSATVTCGVGPAINPFVTLTFKDGAFAAAPNGIASIQGCSDLADSSLFWRLASTTTTQANFRLAGTPTNARTYAFHWVIIG